jgi:hypothetical protein
LEYVRRSNADYMHSCTIMQLITMVQLSNAFAEREDMKRCNATPQRGA